jgi:hypothetical protein
MLPALPSPGTPQFAKLAGALQAFVVDPRGITFEAPSTRMADVSLNFALLRGEARLQFTYEGFEILVAQLVDEHLAVIPKLAAIARQVLQESCSGSAPGRYQVTYSAHLGLEPGRAASLLAEYLPVRSEDRELAPDGFAYRVQRPDRPEVVEMRLVVAQSLRLKEAVYVEFTATYLDELPAEEVANKAIEDTLNALAKVGLKNQRGDAK